MRALTCAALALAAAAACAAPPLALAQAGGGDLAVLTDRRSYLPGQTAVVTVHAPAEAGAAAANATAANATSANATAPAAPPAPRLEVRGPAGEALFAGDAGGDGPVRVYLPAAGFGPGTYVAEASLGGRSASASFELLPAAGPEGPISLDTGRRAYAPGDEVAVLGTVNGRWAPSVAVEVRQESGAGRASYDAEERPSPSDGSFSHAYRLPSGPAAHGEYRVTAYHGTGSAEARFAVAADPASHEPGPAPALTVGTDRRSYDRGDRFAVSGRVADPLPGAALFATPVEIRISGPGLAAHELTARPDAAGNYRVEDSLHATLYGAGEYRVGASYAAAARAASAFSVSDPLAGPGTLRLEASSESIRPGGTLSVAGAAPGLPQGVGVVITLHKPGGGTEQYGTLADSSRFSWEWTAPARGAEPGAYRADFEAGPRLASVAFEVSAGPGAGPAAAGQLEVRTDRAEYASGDELAIEGSVPPGGPAGERARIAVRDSGPPFRQLYESFAAPGAGGAFSAGLALTPSLFPDGEYVATASYGGRSASAQFAVSGAPEAAGGPSLALRADRAEYAPGDTVRLEVVPSGAAPPGAVGVTFIREDPAASRCGPSLCGEPSPRAPAAPGPGGSFHAEHELPAGAPPGRYEAVADAGFGAFGLVFEVAAPEAAAPGPAAPARTVERSGRLPGSEFAILTGWQDGPGDPAPRSVRGSLAVRTADGPAAADLRVSSAGGTCVIGPGAGCLVSDSTLDGGPEYRRAEIDGMPYRVSYTGPGAAVESFAILPAPGGAIHVGWWDVEVIKDGQPTRFHYKVTRAAQ